MLAAAFATFAFLPAGAVDLSRASVTRLDNGLTLIMLEERTFPVVSIQTVYKTGAKDDPAGRLGLAHFFEHMAFRGSTNFPDTGLVSEIYAVGGEWHGYTWIDNTNYFATTPKEHLGLLLDIEADRMARLDLKRDEVEAERGAVLAEMNGYANDPESTLFDALMAAHFLTHPYRNNTVGYPADIEAIGYADITAFYERHYAPPNAVIAIVGDFDRAAALAMVKAKFGAIRKSVAPRDPLTPEIARSGERRVRLSLPSDEKLFKVAYPAPAASHADFPAYLVLQALAGQSGGANFNQNDWGTPVGDGSPLARAYAGLRSWIIPTAAPYAFVLSGSASPQAKEAKIEQRIQEALDRLAAKPAADADLAAAIEETRAALAFDVDTTEEAAHQLAYFAGVGAFDQLLTLPEKVAAVTAADVMRVASTYLRADRRTIAWLTPGEAAPGDDPSAPAEFSERTGAAAANAALPAAEMFATETGAPFLFQPANLSSTFSIAAVLAGRFSCDLCTVDAPSLGETTISASSTAANAAAAMRSVADAIRVAVVVAATPPASNDPMTRLEEIFAGAAGVSQSSRTPVVFAAAGDVVRDDVASLAARFFAGASSEGEPDAPVFRPLGGADIFVEGPKAQHAVGYAVLAPAAGTKESLATAIALYVLSHGYEGRLGKEAITRRGLLYYIDAQFRAGRSGGLVTLTAGVDPEKVDAFRDLMKAEIARLKTEPPTDAEIAEAKRHLTGRKISAAQSNGELTDALLKDFLAVGAPENAGAFAERLEKATRADVLAAVEALQKGAVVTVRGGGVD